MVDSSRKQNFPEKERLVKLASELLETAAALPDDEAEPALSAKLVTQEMLCRLTGYTPDRLSALRRRGDVIQGVHFVITPQNKIDWDIEEFDKWRRGHPQAVLPVSSSGMITSGSKSSIVANGSMNAQSFQQRREALEKRRSSAKPSTASAAKVS